MSDPNRHEMDAKSKFALVYKLLAQEYGEPDWRPHLSPVDELISTILSQNTSDANRDTAFMALKSRFPDWDSVMNAPVDEVVEAIRPAGLANQKGPRIQQALRTIQQEVGEIRLDFLDQVDLDSAKGWLTAIHGVGPKTAAIVLLFAFGRPAFPVDTHVHRVTKRLGLIGPKVTADKAHEMLENMGAEGTFYAFHLNLIRHGREICFARKPDCDRCFLTHLCNYYSANRKVEES